MMFNKKLNLLLILGASAWGAMACGQKTATAGRQEVIDGLRVLGTSTGNVAIATLSEEKTPQTVEIIVYAAVPLGQTASLEAYDLTASGQNVDLAASDLTIDPAKFQYDDHSAFRLLRAPITAKVPLSSKFAKATDVSAPAQPVEPGTTSSTSVGGDVNFGLKVSCGDSVITMTSLFAAREAGADELKWTAPQITAMTPQDKASVGQGDVAISMTATAANDTRMNYGWFVSGGSIADRRVQSSTWTPSGAGGYTLVGIVHGRSTRGFDLKVFDVTVN